MVVDGYFLAGPVVIIQFALEKYNGVCGGVLPFESLRDAPVKKKINRLINIIIFCSIGQFIGSVLYNYWHFRKYPLILGIIFLSLTFTGGGYVLINHGQVNAGYAVVPGIFSIICFAYYRTKE